MKPQDLFDYVISAKKVNPNVIQSMAEKIKEEEKNNIAPLIATENGHYPLPRITKTIRKENFIIDRNSHELVADPRMPYLKGLYIVPCDIDNPLTPDNFAENLARNDVDIKIYGAYKNSDKIIVVNKNTVPQLIKEGIINFDSPLITRIGPKNREVLDISAAALNTGTFTTYDEPGLIFLIYDEENFKIEATYTSTFKTQVNSYYPLDINVVPKVEALTITENGIYKGNITKEITSHVVQTRDSLNAFPVPFFDEEIYGIAYSLEVPTDLSLKNLHQYFVDKKLSIFLPPLNLTLDANVVDPAIQMGLISEVEGMIHIIPSVILCPFSLKTLGEHFPDRPGMIVAFDPNGQSWNIEVNYTQTETIQLDGYLPVTVNVPQGKPIPVATEAEMDTLSTEHKPENIGSYYTYTGETGKYTQNKDYKLSETGFTL